MAGAAPSAPDPTAAAGGAPAQAVTRPGGGGRGPLLGALELLLVFGLPLVVCVGWTRALLALVDAHERSIAPMGSLAYATFAQLADSFAEGRGWVQTVHRGYAQSWTWGGHYTPLYLISAKLSGLSTSPWALARLQVGAVGLGVLAAARLGWAEGRLAGLVAGLVLYASSTPIMVMALADYQDLVLVIPALPLAVWGARHGRGWQAALCLLLLGATREEALLLLPAVGLTGGLGRGLLGAAVAAGLIGLYQSMGPPLYDTPLVSILEFEGRVPLGHALRAAQVPWDMHAFLAGPALPLLFLGPELAAAAAPIAWFHALDPASVRNLHNPSVHHLAPMVAVLTTAAVLGAGRACRLGRLAGLVVVLAAGGLAWRAHEAWRPLWQDLAVRARPADRDRERHRLWDLLAQVPEDDVLYIDHLIVAAAARRPYVVTRDSEDDPQAVAALGGRPVAWALVPGPFVGEAVGSAAGHTLYKIDPAQPYLLLQRPLHGQGAPAGPPKQRPGG